MARNIIDALGAFTAPGNLGPSRPEAAIPSASTASSPPSDEDPFATRMEAALAHDSQSTTPVVGGTVELVGLDDVRRALGKTWASVAEKVGELAEAEVQASLGPNDFYRAYGTSSFLICFVGLQKSDAEKRARHVATRIRARLAHYYPNIAHEISPEPFVAVLEGDLLVDDGRPLVDRLVQHLVKLRNDVERSVSRLRSPLLRRSKLLFAPAWHSAKRTTGYNRCILDSLAKDALGESFRLQVGGSEYQQTVAELDYITLTRSLRSLYMMLKTGRVVPLLVPVTYQTIRGSESGPSYRRLLETMKPVHKSLLALEIVDIPEHEHGQSVFEHVSQLAPLVRWLALQVELEDLRIAEFARAPLWALATDLERRKSTEARLHGQLRQFRAIAAEGQLNTLVHGANSIGLALAAMETGVTYIDGPAIQPPSKEPRTPTPLNPVLPVLPPNRSAVIGIERRR